MKNEINENPALSKMAVSGSASRTYKYWDVLECLPLNWKIGNTVGSPLCGYEFCTNGKSVLNGQKRALVKVIRKNTPRIEFVKIEEKKEVRKMHIPEYSEKDFIFPSRTANTLARKKFQEHLLKEIIFDLMVCEIEGWDKKEYINEIKSLLNSIDISKKKTNKKSSDNQLDFLNAIGF